MSYKKEQALEFIDMLAPIAQKAFNNIGKILPSICIAMAIVESDCGQSNIMKKNNALLGQKVGTGKTHLALSIIRECGGLYRLSSNIVEELRRAKSFTAKESEAEILENYGNARLLVIDEIGRGVAGAEEQYMLYQIINERYNRRKPTILISNQTKKDFLSYIGIAAADRLTESAQVVEFTWQSYRAVIRRDRGLNEARTAGV